MPDDPKVIDSTSTSSNAGDGGQSQLGNVKRMILMGTGPFAVPSFEAIRLAGYPIAMVVTKPAPPVKSRKGPPPAPVRLWAEANGLPVFDPPSINDSGAVARIASENPWLLVVCDYGQILKPDALAAAQIGGINLHGSLLPAYRGAAPVQWALLSGDAVTGVSVIHMTPRLDGGPIIVTDQTPITDDETAGQLEERLSQIGVGATIKAIELLSRWDGQTTIGQVQDASKATKAPRLAKSDGQIDWGRSAGEIDCHVRGMQPWPVAFTQMMVDAEKPPVRLAILEVSATDIDSSEMHPGEVRCEDRFLVATADRMLEIKRLKPAGKREMDAQEFLRGQRPAEGTRLFS